MNTINFIVWILPVIFMIHDFEEIIMAEVWGKRYRAKIDRIFPHRKPFGIGEIRTWETPSFSAAVAVEFVLFSVISFLSVIYQNYFLWFSAFMGLLVHMVIIHIVVCFFFRGYVPGMVTSILLLIPGVRFLLMAQENLHFDVGLITLSAIAGILMLVILLPALHKLIGLVDGWLTSYGEEKEIQS